MASKKNAAVSNKMFECPVCLEMMTAPIYQCKSGHSLCNKCTSALRPPLCPICRQDMTQIRNRHLEEIISVAQVPCPNKHAGCVYELKTIDVESHLLECIFRKMDCPLGVVFGKCSWNGEMKSMMDHFKERHPSNCNINPDSEVQLDNLSITEDERFVYLVSLQKFNFIMTIKLDTLQKMAFWAVQHIGTKKGALQWIYEIHIMSKGDTRRKVVYTEHCFNDALKADEVFRTGKCAMIPLESLSTFIKDKKLYFRFFIKKTGPTAPKDNPNQAGNENKAPKDPGNHNGGNKPQNKGSNKGNQKKNQHNKNSA